MAQALQSTTQEEWLKVLGKGMITLAKKWRDEMGIEDGGVVKAKKEGNTVVIEAQAPRQPAAPYRVYSADEIKEFLDEDKLPEGVAEKVQERLLTPSAQEK